MPDLSFMSSREGAKHKSIYSKVPAGDSTDNVAVALTVRKHCKPKRDAMVDMKKMSPRNFGSLVPTEAYKNVLRDNARADRIKNLMEVEDE